MTIVERLGGRKASITLAGLFVLLIGYIFCTYAGGDSPTFLSFAGSVCVLCGAGFAANATVHKFKADEAVATTKADSAEAVATTKAEADKAVAITNAG